MWSLFMVLIFTACEKHEYETAFSVPMNLNPSAEYRVLCLGNSITYHAPNINIGWASDWGMAASTAENDYCHQLERLIHNHCSHSTVTGKNISVWEKDPGIDFESLIGQDVIDKNIIIIRLGENVTNIDSFQSRLRDLINYCRHQTPNIIITGCFWYRNNVDKALKQVAIENNLNYIPLVDIYFENGFNALNTQEPLCKDTSGNSYLLTNAFVKRHPGDYGMYLIAKKLHEILFPSQ